MHSSHNLRVRKAHSRSPSPNILCKVNSCSKSCKSRSGLIRHVRLMHPDYLLESESDADEEVSDVSCACLFVVLTYDVRYLIFLFHLLRTRKTAPPTMTSTTTHGMIITLHWAHQEVLSRNHHDDHGLKRSRTKRGTEWGITADLRMRCLRKTRTVMMRWEAMGTSLLEVDLVFRLLKGLIRSLAVSGHFKVYAP